MTGSDWVEGGAPSPIELAATAYGPRNAPPVVVLHGLFGSSRNWSSIARRLADRWQVIAPDIRNHGASPWSDVMSYAAMAADLNALITDRLDGRPAVLVGHSMGGKAAMVLALTRPELVERLVVVDVAPIAYPPAFVPYAQAMTAARLEGVSRRAEVDVQLADAVPEPGVRAFLLQNLVLEPERARWRINLAVLTRALPEIARFPAVPNDVSYDAPTTFISGGRSTYLSDEALSEIDRLFPAARRVVVPDAGHWVHVDQPQEFLARLVEALGSGERD